MNARDKLIELFDAGGPHHLFSSEEVAGDVLDEHAKELAKRVLELRSHVSGSRRNRAFDGGYLAGLIAAALEIESPREEKA